MKHNYVAWTVNVLGLILLILAIWWLVAHISSLPDYKLIAALTAMTGFILNHCRWSSLGKKINDRDTLEKINALIASNYMILLLVFVFVDLRR
jgi:chromate transport protein ChrA